MQLFRKHWYSDLQDVRRVTGFTVHPDGPVSDTEWKFYAEFVVKQANGHEVPLCTGSVIGKVDGYFPVYRPNPPKSVCTELDAEMKRTVREKYRGAYEADVR